MGGVLLVSSNTGVHQFEQPFQKPRNRQGIQEVACTHTERDLQPREMGKKT